MPGYMENFKQSRIPTPWILKILSEPSPQDTQTVSLKIIQAYLLKRVPLKAIAMYFGPRLTCAGLPSQVTKNQFQCAHSKKIV